VRIDPSATLLAAPMAMWLAKPGWRALLNGDGLADVTITGGGTIDGKGAGWWNATHGPAGSDEYRPHMVQLHGTRGLVIDDVTLLDVTPNHNIMLQASLNVRIRRLRVHASMSS